MTRGQPSPGADDVTVRQWRQLAGSGRLVDRVRQLRPHIERLLDAHLGPVEEMTNDELRRRWLTHFADRRRRDTT